MFVYKPKGKPRITNPHISSIPMRFWDEIRATPKNEWPGIVRKYKLTPEQMVAAAGRIKTVEDRMEKTGTNLNSCICNPYKFA